MKSRLSQIIASIILGILSLGVGFTFFGDTLPKSRLVDAGGHRLEVVVAGEGSPAVVFDAGMGGGMLGWASARDSVALHTSTVIFERAGFGSSEEGPRPRTAERLARELHTALENAGIEFPVVLVGHSAGGLHSMVFAAEYANDVAGLVLVDAATEESWRWIIERGPGPWSEKVREIMELHDPSPGWIGQIEALPETLEQARNAWPLPQVPTVVLSSLSPQGVWPFESDEAMKVWECFQRALAVRIPGTEHIVLPEAHHLSILREAVLREKIIEVARRAAGR